MPMSSTSRSMNSSACARTRSAMRRRVFARSAAFIFGQGPSSNARRAAATARSTSAAAPSAASVIGSLVAGSSVVNVAPETLARNCPSM
jgi:hypothetical protein